MRCERCGAKSSEGAAYCTRCGAPLASSKEGISKRCRIIAVVVVTALVVIAAVVAAFVVLAPASTNTASSLSSSAGSQQNPGVGQEAQSSTNSVPASLSESKKPISDATKPFWGIWIYASKDYGSAAAFASDVKPTVGSPEVFLTAEWSNLNPEPWYAVSYSVAADEPSANALCEEAKHAGYADAYAKYSGDYVTGTDDPSSAVEGYLARIQLPKPVMERVHFDTSKRNVITAKAGDVALFQLFSPTLESKNYPDERKRRMYSLGYAGDGFQALDVRLELYYVNEAGDRNVHWNDEPSIDLAIEKLLGLTVDELVAGIELRDMRPADVVDKPDPEVKWKAPEELALVGDDAS